MNDRELNDLKYEKAIKKDKRTYWQYYFSLVKTNHLLIFSFWLYNDYNSRIIKIDLFFINFTIYYMINALFFNDNTMHKIYEDGGKFNFIYNLPKIVLSSLITSILYGIIKLLALSESLLLKLKQQKKMNIIKAKETVVYKYLKVKFISFAMIGFVLLLIMFYYLICFCAVYKNTQIHLIKDSLISFGISLIYPLFVYLIPGIFRIPSLKKKTAIKKMIYNFSKLIQFFID